MSAPKLSVIIPVYKTEKYIDECIKSVLSQSFEDFELILVDDGSPDRCGEIIDLYAERDSRIKVIHKKNEGVVRARNDGARMATGDYIVNIDSDDYITEGAFECLSKNIEKSNADVCFFGSIIHYGDKTEKCLPRFSPGIYSDEGKKKGLYERLVYDSEKPFYSFGVNPALSVKIIKRELYIKYAFDVDSSIKIGEDFALSLPAMLSADTLLYIDKPLYVYRVLDESVSHKFDENLMLYFKKMLDSFEKNCIDLDKYNLKGQLGVYASYALFNFMADAAMSLKDCKSYLRTMRSIDKKVFDYIRRAKLPKNDLTATAIVLTAKLRLWRTFWIYMKSKGDK